MSKKNRFIIILMVLLSTPLFASMADVYVIRMNNFSLTLQFEEGYRTPSYLMQSNALFWDILAWAYTNKRVLETKTFSINLLIDYTSNKILYPWLDIPPGIEKQDIDNTIQKYGNYTNKDELVNSISIIVSSLLKIKCAVIVDNIKIDMYSISVELPNCIIDQYNKTALFFGSKYGDMVSDRTNRRYIFFWNLQDAEAYRDNYEEMGYIIEAIVLTKINVYDIFDGIL